MNDLTPEELEALRKRWFEGTVLFNNCHWNLVIEGVRYD